MWFPNDVFSQFTRPPVLPYFLVLNKPYILRNALYLLGLELV